MASEYWEFYQGQFKQTSFRGLICGLEGCIGVWVYGCVQRVARSEALAHSKTKGEKKEKEKRAETMNQENEKLMRKKTRKHTKSPARRRSSLLTSTVFGFSSWGAMVLPGGCWRREKFPWGGEVGGHGVH